tara:strand:- start:1137 stop:1733 length:597 start_codon:yes stop_codon:yes gene_type:complete
MDVFRDGKAIGFSNYFFNYENQFLEVKNETKFDVQLLGVKIFSIRSKGVEKYFKNKLISFKSETQQNDKKKYVNLEVTDKKDEFKINGSSYKGKAEISSIVGNWWNHDILEANTQISPLSGSIKDQVVKFIGEKNININNKIYKSKHYKILSKNPNIPEEKKLNFDIWYSKKENLILKVSYNRLGQWEYIIKKYVIDY